MHLSKQFVSVQKQIQLRKGNLMTYEEALEIINELIEDKSMIMEYENKEMPDFTSTAIAYMPLNADEMAMRMNGNGFRWDMIIRKDRIEYRQLYRNLSGKIVKVKDTSIQIKRVTKETFRNFLQEQLILGRSYR